MSEELDIMQMQEKIRKYMDKHEIDLEKQYFLLKLISEDIETEIINDYGVPIEEEPEIDEGLLEDDEEPEEDIKQEPDVYEDVKEPETKKPVIKSIKLNKKDAKGE